MTAQDLRHELASRAAAEAACTQAVIYTRFSDRRGAEECDSCETQEAICRAHAAARGWTVRAAFADEAISGAEVHRPGLEGALEALEEGDVLVVYRRDRLARDVLLAELLRRRVAAAGARIEAVSGDVAGDDASPEVLFVRQILSAVAELERRQIAARTRDTMRALQARGRRVGRHAPYGWAIDPADPSRLVLCRSEWDAIRRIKELARSGLTPAAIAQEMNREFPDRCRGRKWDKRTIPKIARREFTGEA